MDILTILRIAARRWYVVVPAGVVLLLIVGVVSSDVKPYYEARGDVIFRDTPVEDTADGGGVSLVNPYSPRIVGSAVSRVVQNQSARTILADEGLAPDYSLATDRDGIIYEIVVTADDPQVALDTVPRIVEEVQIELDRLQDQANVDQGQRVIADAFNTSPQATTITSERIRVVGTVMLVGLTAIVGLALLVDTIMNRRASRGAARGGSAEGDSGWGPSAPLSPSRREGEWPVSAVAGEGMYAVSDDPFSARLGASSQGEADHGLGYGSAAEDRPSAAETPRRPGAWQRLRGR